MRDLDDVDGKLLEMLQKDGRTTYSELGQAVGLAVSSVNERVRKLNEQGVIQGVHAHISPEALRLELLAFIFVGWNEPHGRTALPGAHRAGKGGSGVPPRHGRLELPAEGTRPEHQDAGRASRQGDQGGGRRGAHRDAHRSVLAQGDGNSADRATGLVHLSNNSGFGGMWHSLTRPAYWLGRNL